ncbi:MAG: histidine--tRNA ligase [Candidatus Saliniplasma sp.]
MIERPRGTRDLDPDEMEIRRKIEQKLRDLSRSFGYREILTPTFEYTELFTQKSGPDIVNELYHFEDKGGRDIALRPEFTASVIRAYNEGMRELPKPLKLFYFGPVFRYERPQSGRYREFWHFGTELIGPDTFRADAENIALAYMCVKKIGLKDFKLKVSNLKILDKFLEENGIDKKERDEIYHKIDKEEVEEVSKKYDLGSELSKFLNSDLDDLSHMLQDIGPVEHLKAVLDSLKCYDIDEKHINVDLSTVRGLDYYKGVVFEIDADTLGAEKQILGGGDYNLGDIFGIDVSSKGFAMGFDRSILALEAEGKSPEMDKMDCYIIPIGEESLEYSYNILQELRTNGIITDIDLMDRSVGKALGYADKNGFEYTLLIGENEVNDDTITIKDMHTGDQKTIGKDDLIGEVKEIWN